MRISALPQRSVSLHNKNDVNTEAGMTCLFLSFVGKKCRSWNGCCSAENRMVQSSLDVTSINDGKEEHEDAVWD